MAQLSDSNMIGPMTNRISENATWMFCFFLVVVPIVVGWRYDHPPVEREFIGWDYQGLPIVKYKEDN